MIKKFNDWIFSKLSSDNKICKEYDIENYTINKDGTVDVDGNVYLSHKKLTRLPIKFGKVTGSFHCDYNQLVSLDGSPKEVGGSFYCNNNQLTSLEGSPRIVGGSFMSSHNKLITLEGAPKIVSDGFYFSSNPIWNIYAIFRTYEDYVYSLDYNYLRGTNIVKSRFKEALEEIGVELPEKIEGYNYI